MLVYSDSIYQRYNHSMVKNLTILHLDISNTFNKVPQVLQVIEM